MVGWGSMGKRNGWGVRENAYGRRGEGTIEGEGWRWVNKWKKGKEDLSKEFLVDLKRLGQLLIWREREREKDRTFGTRQKNMRNGKFERRGEKEAEKTKN